MVWIFIGVIACALLGWYLYQRSKNNTTEDPDQATDAEANNDEFEDLLLTGVLLSEIYGEDEDSSDDVDADDHILMDDGGFDDSGGFE